MKNEITEEIVRNKAEVYCATSEHCISEVEGKLYQWGATKDLTQKVIGHLLEDGFIDECRYALAFVRDKYRFNAWGKMKITLSLRQKGISDDLIDKALEGIDDATYTQTLKTLLDQKSKTIKAASNYERKGKLIRFALSRGFSMNEILPLVHLDSDEKTMEDL